MTQQDAPERKRGKKKWLVILILVIAAGIQLIPYGRAHSHGEARLEPAWSNTEARALFIQACGDCHSFETRWPWYSHVAPVSWLVQHDVDEGRRHFNAQEWGRERNHGDEAADLLESGDMPPWYYKPFHSGARLSAADRQKLIDGLAATFGRDTEGEAEGAAEGEHPEGQEHDD